MPNGVNGVNGYSGLTLDQFIQNSVIVRSDTIPVAVTYKEDGVIKDVTGFELWLTLVSSINSADPTKIILEKKIPITDAAGGAFSGSITDGETYALPLGSFTISMKIIDPLGQSFIIDMAKYKVLDCANPRA